MAEIVKSSLNHPDVKAIIEAGGLPTPVDYEHVDTVLLLREAGEPVAFAAGFIWDGHPVLEHVGVRPGRWTRRQVYLILEAFAEEFFKRGYDCVLTTVRHQNPKVRAISAVVKRWPAKKYADDGIRGWWVHRRRLN